MKAVNRLSVPVHKLAEYYQHLEQLSKGYIKDPRQLDESVEHIKRWKGEVRKLTGLIR